MRRRFHQCFASLLLATLLLTPVHAQESGSESLPQPTGRVNDFAGVIDAQVKERVENMLANLKERGGIEFHVAIVKTTEGKDVADYSLELARAWKTGTMQNRDKSLLLVISTEKGEFLTQISKGFRSEMPDGLVGDMGARMREQIAKSNYNEALTSAVETFITQIAKERGFSTEGMEQAPAQASTETQPASTPTTTDAMPTTVAVPKEAEAKPTPSPSTESEAKEPAAQKPSATRQRTLKDAFTKETARKAGATGADDPDKVELETIAHLPSSSERVEKLKSFIDAHPDSNLKPVATELLVSAHAALGDEKLQAGDPVGGVAEFSDAITQTPDKMSDALFIQVVSQIPANLYMRGQRSTSVDAAHLIEAKVKDDPKRLLALAGFFLNIENADEAARLSELAIKLAPDMAEAHQALGAAHHVALRLDEAATEYARALELNPKLTQARRGLADLKRASGKTEDALSLYREQLTADATDERARAGVVLSLLDLGKKEEAAREMEAALKENEKNLPLLVGASYWYAAHDEAERAQELASKAIGIEPRYTWAHIALARALVAQKRPLDAERVLRFARAYGNFPTLDYELASALAASGLYEDAAAELSRTFTIKDGKIETRLAGRVPASSVSFIELLAPERRAGIFQATPADTEANARMLKGLLEFKTAIGSQEGKGNVDSALLASAQEDFLTGEDAMRAFRQLYAASRLLRRGAELPKAAEIAESASSGVEAALDSPVATVGVMADELSDARAHAITTGQVLSVPVFQRSVLANIMRGRIEDLVAWSLFNQDKTSDAITHLKRALSVLPEGSPWWRTAQWHMGTALEATGNQQDALEAYIKGYDPAQPDPVRRAIIETLYRKVNGSLDGLNAKIGPA
ncbi:MAG TPA: TPM domain-containing protein [Pyrinomonadaceae bacterium]